VEKAFCACFTRVAACFNCQTEFIAPTVLPISEKKPASAFSGHHEPPAIIPQRLAQIRTSATSELLGLEPSHFLDTPAVMLDLLFAHYLSHLHRWGRIIFTEQLANVLADRKIFDKHDRMARPPL
jgi:hypothetical protein